MLQLLHYIFSKYKAQLPEDKTEKDYNVLIPGNEEPLDRDTPLSIHEYFVARKKKQLPAMVNMIERDQEEIEADIQDDDPLAVSTKLSIRLHFPDQPRPKHFICDGEQTVNDFLLRIFDTSSALLGEASIDDYILKDNSLKVFYEGENKLLWYEGIRNCMIRKTQCDMQLTKLDDGVIDYLEKEHQVMERIVELEEEEEREVHAHARASGAHAGRCFHSSICRPYTCPAVASPPKIAMWKNEGIPDRGLLIVRLSNRRCQSCVDACVAGIHARTDYLAFPSYACHACMYARKNDRTHTAPNAHMHTGTHRHAPSDTHSHLHAHKHYHARRS